MWKKLTNNLGLKLISVVFAVILWLVVVNIDDPVTTRTFTDIPVTILNEDTITNEGKVYEVLDGSDELSIVVKAKRSVIDSLSATDFYATADMKEINLSMGIVQINVTPLRYSKQINEIIQKTTNLKVSVEDLKEKQFAVNYSIEGTPGEGYAIGDVDMSPNALTISGPQSVVNNINKVVITIGVDGMTSDLDLRLEPVLLNSEGKKIETNNLQFDYNKIHTTVNILETKTVPLNFVTKGEPAEGYQLVSVEYEPSSVELKGDPDVLSTITQITVSSDLLDISSATKDVQTVVDISNDIPEGAQLTDADNANVAIIVKIEKLESKTLKVSTDKLDVQNTPKNLELTFTSDTFDINVMGGSEELDSITEKDITGTLDLSGYEAGTYTADITVSCPDTVIVESDVTVRIILEEKSSDENSQDSKKQTSKQEDSSDDSGNTQNNNDAQANDNTTDTSTDTSDENSDNKDDTQDETDKETDDNDLSDLTGGNDTE